MMNISFIASNTLHELAAFLEKLNNIREHHVGFCGEKGSEIKATLERDFSDIGVSKSFIVGYDGMEIKGAVGLDVDTKEESAEVWGPFVDEDDPEMWLDTATILWQQLIDSLTVPVSTFQFFINQHNVNAKKFILKLNGMEKGDHDILTCDRTQFYPPLNHDVRLFTNNHTQSFKKLHDSLFPQTYYDAEEILKKINEPTNKLLIIEKEQIVIGYAYVEVEPEHGEGQIEYIGIAPDYRRQGLATQLLTNALHVLFSYPTVEDITLCVSKQNTKAIRLYQAAGFKKERQLTYFELNVDGLDNRRGRG
ncbi:GNAT family N-acetyltransferase [Halalkalibacterium halodurans]|nr:N-acetyltransferase [Halalkalibacterium halodurans]